MVIRRQPESQNQNDSNDEQVPHFAGPSVNKDAVKVDIDKDTDKVTDKVTDKFAIVSSVFVRLRTFLVSSIYPVRASSVVVGESGQSAVIEHFERLPKRPRSRVVPIVVPWSSRPFLKRFRPSFVDVIKARKMTIFATIVVVFI